MIDSQVDMNNLACRGHRYAIKHDNHVDMRLIYVDIRLIYVDMRYEFVDMRLVYVNIQDNHVV